MNLSSLFRPLATAFVAALALGVLSSCDEDVDEAMALSGEWRGDFGMYYNYTDRFGRIHTFDSYDTRIVFYPEYDYATHGWGKQVDYYEYGPYEFQYYHFAWSIRNGVVYLRYPGAPELNTSIAEYRLTNDYFSGRFTNATSSFRLYKLADYYDWTPYVNVYGYYVRSGWSAPVKGEAFQSGAADSASAQDPFAGGSIVGRGNRFTDGK